MSNNPRMLVLALAPQQIQGINDFMINDYGKWFDIYEYESAQKLFHAIQIWVLDAGLGPTYSIMQFENVNIPVRKTINRYSIEILAPTNQQIDDIIKHKPEPRKEDEEKKEEEKK